MGKVSHRRSYFQFHQGLSSGVPVMGTTLGENLSIPSRIINFPPIRKLKPCNNLSIPSRIINSSQSGRVFENIRSFNSIKDYPGSIRICNNCSVFILSIPSRIIEYVDHSGFESVEESFNSIKDYQFPEPSSEQKNLLKLSIPSRIIPSWSVLRWHCRYHTYFQFHQGLSSIDHLLTSSVIDDTFNSIKDYQIWQCFIWIQDIKLSIPSRII